MLPNGAPNRRRCGDTTHHDVKRSTVLSQAEQDSSAPDVVEPTAGARRPWPGWVRVLLVYVASRAVTTAIMALVYWLAATVNWPFASYTKRPDFVRFMDSWDGLFYRQIALHGYPTQLPFDANGHVEPNAWAFLPVYPWLTRGVMSATGISFSVVGVSLSVLFGAGAALVLYRILVARVGQKPAIWAVVFFCAGPMSFILQATYAEALFLLLMFASLWALTARRYLLMIPFGVIAAFTHPGALALAAAIGILFLVRLARRQPFERHEAVRMIVSAAVIAIAGFAWPFVASAGTGYRSAYFDTELAWWTGYVGRIHFIPFTPWFVMAGKYLGPAGWVVVVAAVILFVVWLSRRSMRVLGDDLLAYSGTYAAYLVAVFLPQQSLVRLVMPLAPLLATPALTRSRLSRGITLGVLIASQPLVIITLWFLGPP
jgi:hypothetical protein